MSEIGRLIERIERDLDAVKRLLGDDPAVRYTGCRATRGSHGQSFVHEPLGTDVPPPGWPHPRPTRGEVEAALRAREDSRRDGVGAPGIEPGTSRV